MTSYKAEREYRQLLRRALLLARRTRNEGDALRVAMSMIDSAAQKRYNKLQENRAGEKRTRSK